MNDIISASFRIATPIMLAAVGGLLCFRAGVFNIGLEGLMLVGSFAGVAGVILGGGSVYVGFLVAILAGILMAALFALASVKLRANEIVVSLAINMLALGLTSFLLRAIFDTTGALRPDTIHKLTEFELPLLGKLIGKQSIVTYFAIIAIFIVHVIMRHTHLGIEIQSVGESPETALTCGIRTKRIKVAMLLLSGAFCGLAGAYLSTVVVSEFTENMVSGRGFTAFTAVAFANSNPVLTFLVSLLLGFADAAGIRLEIQSTGVSPSIVKMFPYLLALLVYTLGTAIRNINIRRKSGG